MGLIISPLSLLSSCPALAVLVLVPLVLALVVGCWVLIVVEVWQGH